jgi:hypothetical protein
VTTNAETINVGVLGIDDVFHYTRVFAFDDSAVSGGTLAYASILLMAVDIVGGAKVFRGFFLHTDVKLTAIVWVGNISV